MNVCVVLQTDRVGLARVTDWLSDAVYYESHKDVKLKIFTKILHTMNTYK